MVTILDNIRVIFKLGMAKTAAYITIYHEISVYRIPCSCGKCILVRWRRLETGCRKGELEKSAIPAHAWNHHQPTCENKFW